MNRDEVIDRLCGLVTYVGIKRYDSNLPHDCFCPSGDRIHGAVFKFESVHPEILAFIENAVFGAVIDTLRKDKVQS